MPILLKNSTYQRHRLDDLHQNLDGKNKNIMRTNIYNIDKKNKYSMPNAQKSKNR